MRVFIVNRTRRHTEKVVYPRFTTKKKRLLGLAWKIVQWIVIMNWKVVFSDKKGKQLVSLFDLLAWYYISYLSYLIHNTDMFSINVVLSLDDENPYAYKYEWSLWRFPNDSFISILVLQFHPLFNFQLMYYVTRC